MKTEIRPLTGLRGAAAVWVALYHIHWRQVTSGAAPMVLRHGYLAVDIFFVLSGFVMMMTYASGKTSRWSPAKYFDFILRRIGRVWPAYVLVTLLLALLMVVRILKPHPPHLVAFLANLSLTETWWGVHPVDEPAWSVSSELLAYIVFPLIAISAIWLRPVLRGLVVLALLAAVYGFPALQTLLAGHPMGGNGPLDISANATPVPLLRCLVEFTIGTLTYKFATASVLKTAAKPLVAALVLVVFIALLFIPDSDVLCVAMTPALVVVAAASGPVVNAVLGNVVVYALGCWSYSLYLVHFHSNAIQIVALKHLGRLGAAGAPVSYALQYGVLIVVSALLYRFCEKPAQRAFRGLARRLENTFASEHLKPEVAKGAV